MDKIVPKILYHYCNIETFFKIITSKTLWLTDSNNTNDYLENRWINPLIEEYIKEKVDDNNKDWYQQLVMQYNINQPPSFICCFSEEGDLLSQWRAYANNGCGVSIGFNIEYFNSNVRYGLPLTIAVYNENSIGLHEVVYERTIQRQIIQDIITGSVAVGTSKIPTWLNAAIVLRMHSYVFKNPAFQEEREWRIVHTPLLNSYIPPLAPDKKRILSAISECFFRYTSTTITPYFTLSIKDEREKAPHPINEVIIGPKSMITEAHLRLFLERNEFYGVQIKRSTASYR